MEENILAYIEKYKFSLRKIYIECGRFVSTKHANSIVLITNFTKKTLDDYYAKHKTYVDPLNTNAFFNYKTNYDIIAGQIEEEPEIKEETVLCKSRITQYKLQLIMLLYITRFTHVELSTICNLDDLDNPNNSDNFHVNLLCPQLKIIDNLIDNIPSNK
jgi:hypothetical protein